MSSPSYNRDVACNLYIKIVTKKKKKLRILSPERDFCMEGENEYCTRAWKNDFKSIKAAIMHM